MNDANDSMQSTISQPNLGRALGQRLQSISATFSAWPPTDPTSPNPPAIGVQNRPATLQSLTSQLEAYEREIIREKFPLDQLKIASDELIAGGQSYRLGEAGSQHLYQRIGAPVITCRNFRRHCAACSSNTICNREPIPNES